MMQDRHDVRPQHTRQPHTSPVPRKAAPTPPVDTDQVLREADQYFTSYHSWTEFYGIDKSKKVFGKLRERNNSIWEFLQNDSEYLRALLIIRDSFVRQYPYIPEGQLHGHVPVRSSHALTASEVAAAASVTDLHDSRAGGVAGGICKIKDSKNLLGSSDDFFPNIDRLIEIHAGMTYNYMRKHKDLAASERYISKFGELVLAQYSDQVSETLANYYGRMGFIKETYQKKYEIYKKYPQFMSYEKKASSSALNGKWSIDDCITKIAIRMTKVVLLLSTIIKNTYNDSTEVDQLEKARDKIHNTILQIQVVKQSLFNRLKLQGYLENFQFHTADQPDADEFYVANYLGKQELLTVLPVRVEIRKSSKIIDTVLIAVFTVDCLAFLQEHAETSGGNKNNSSSSKYQLPKSNTVQFPILRWGKVHGYYREPEQSKSGSSKKNFQFYIIIEHPQPSMSQFTVETKANLEDIAKHLKTGFSQYQDNSFEHIGTEEEKLQREEDEIEAKWERTLIVLNAINRYDEHLISQWNLRTHAFQTFFQESLAKAEAAKAATTSASAASTATTSTKRSGGDAAQDTSSKHTAASNSQFLSPGTNTGGTDCASSTPSRTSSSTTLLSSATYVAQEPKTHGDNMEDLFAVLQENLFRLKFKLKSHGADVTRSNSELESGPKLSIKKKFESIGSHDDRRPSIVNENSPSKSKIKNFQPRRGSIIDIAASLFTSTSARNKNSAATASSSSSSGGGGAATYSDLSSTSSTATAMPPKENAEIAAKFERSRVRRSFSRSRTGATNNNNTADSSGAGGGGGGGDTSDVSARSSVEAVALPPHPSSPVIVEVNDAPATPPSPTTTPPPPNIIETSSFPDSDIVLYLDQLHEAARKLCQEILLAGSTITELKSEQTRLIEQNRMLQEFRREVQKKMKLPPSSRHNHHHHHRRHHHHHHSQLLSGGGGGGGEQNLSNESSISGGGSAAAAAAAAGELSPDYQTGAGFASPLHGGGAGAPNSAGLSEAAHNSFEAGGGNLANDRSASHLSNNSSGGGDSDNNQSDGNGGGNMNSHLSSSSSVSSSNAALSVNATAGGGVGGGADDASGAANMMMMNAGVGVVKSNVNVQLEFERLRSMVREFEAKKSDWEASQKEKKRDMERDMEKLHNTNQRLLEEKEALDKKITTYNERCEALQYRIDHNPTLAQSVCTCECACGATQSDQQQQQRGDGEAGKAAKPVKRDVSDLQFRPTFVLESIGGIATPVELSTIINNAATANNHIRSHSDDVSESQHSASSVDAVNNSINSTNSNNTSSSSMKPPHSVHSTPSNSVSGSGSSVQLRTTIPAASNTATPSLNTRIRSRVKPPESPAIPLHMRGSLVNEKYNQSSVSQDKKSSSNLSKSPDGSAENLCSSSDIFAFKSKQQATHASNSSGNSPASVISQPIKHSSPHHSATVIAHSPFPSSPAALTTNKNSSQTSLNAPASSSLSNVDGYKLPMGLAEKKAKKPKGGLFKK